jgi:hypothetical protein
VAQTNVMAILGLVFAFICWPAGIVLSVIARRQIRETGEQGDGLALAGLVCSCVFGFITVIVMIAVIAAIGHLHTTNPNAAAISIHSWHFYGVLAGKFTRMPVIAV